MLVSLLGPCFKFILTNVGTDQAKIEKILISREIRLGFLLSLVNAIQCEANKSNLRRAERPVGLRAVKMLRDLAPARGGGLAQHLAANICIAGGYDVKDRRAQ